ncbi:hypothetical protein [Rhizobacter sp. P5_C2]
MLTEEELTAYEAKRDLATELLQSVREMKTRQVRVVSLPIMEASNATKRPSHSNALTVLVVSKTRP